MTHMTGPSDLTRLTAYEMAGRLRARDISSRELTLAHLDTAERQNRALNVWLTIDRDRALAEADSADAQLAHRRRNGETGPSELHPLHGIPVGLKDLVTLQGGQATAGSRILAGYVAPYDAHIT